jgi:peptide deformylase
VLRVRGEEVAEERFGTPELAALCDGLVGAMRAANGAGIAAPQCGVSDRIFVVHGTGKNPRYPYKPAIPLTVFINPVLAVSGKSVDLIEGCLSVPGVRGQVRRRVRATVLARRPDGSRFRVEAEGHAAGTLQHENDHLDGVLFPDHAAPGPYGPEALMTWAAFDEHYAPAFLPAAMALRDEYPQGFRMREVQAAAAAAAAATATAAAAAAAAATDEQAAFDALFAPLADGFRAQDGWEARQETPPAAYLHVSRPSWGDAGMDGIHLEAFVLGKQLEARTALVALHCERGCPFQERFMRAITERASAAIRAFPGEYALLGPAGSSVCEVAVPFGPTPGETVERIARELRRLQSLALVIDDTIARCQAEERE